MHLLSTRDDLAQHHDIIEQLLVSSNRVVADDLAAGGIFVSYATTKQTKFTAQTIMNLPARVIAVNDVTGSLILLQLSISIDPQGNAHLTNICPEFGSKVITKANGIDKLTYPYGNYYTRGSREIYNFAYGDDKTAVSRVNNLSNPMVQFARQMMMRY